MSQRWRAGAVLLGAILACVEPATHVAPPSAVHRDAVDATAGTTLDGNARQIEPDAGADAGPDEVSAGGVPPPTPSPHVPLPKRQVMACDDSCRNGYGTRIRVRGDLASLRWTLVTVCHNGHCAWTDVRAVSPRSSDIRGDQRGELYVFANAAVSNGGCEPWCDAVVGLGGFQAAHDGDVFEVKVKHPNEKPVTLIREKARYVPITLCGSTCSLYQTDHRSDPPWPLR